MTTTCPDCGAIYHDDTDCEAIFNQFLALEFQDAGYYGKVHMLTVACYMIQHGRYSDAGLTWIEQKLRDYLEKGVPVEEIRQQARGETGQDKRKWGVIRQPDERALPKIAWSMTIADIAGRYQDAASYQELIKQWARTTLEEMKPLLPKA